MLRRQPHRITVVGDEEAGHLAPNHDGQGLRLTQILMAMIAGARKLGSKRFGVDQLCDVWGQWWTEDGIGVGERTESVVAGGRVAFSGHRSAPSATSVGQPLE